MTFINIDPDTLLNADTIKRIDLNHICPSTQKRCIRLELRVVPEMVEEQAILLPYTPELVAALIKALHPEPEPEDKQPNNAHASLVTLVGEGWQKPIAGYLTVRVPCVGEYLLIQDLENDVFNMFQVDKVCHSLPGDASNGFLLEPAVNDIEPAALLLVSPCIPPFPLYQAAAIAQTRLKD